MVRAEGFGNFLVTRSKAIRRQTKEHDGARDLGPPYVRENDGIPRAGWIYPGKNPIPHPDEQNERKQRGERGDEEGDQRRHE